MIEADHSGPGLRSSISALERFLQSAQRAIGVAGEVNVLLTSNRRMRSLNRKFRGKDKPTDVLSFPALFTNDRVKVAGDIAISLDIARENAGNLGHSVETELKILFLHGLLHLAGHDHESDRGEMASFEHELRAKLKLPMGLIARAVKQSAGDGRIRESTHTPPSRGLR
jgi:probable rRNA maturation factor